MFQRFFLEGNWPYWAKCGKICLQKPLKYGQTQPNFAHFLASLFWPDGTTSFLYWVTLSKTVSFQDNSTLAVKLGLPIEDHHQTHPWGIFFTILGTVLLDFDADSCQSPSRAYLLDVTVPGTVHKGYDSSSWVELSWTYAVHPRLSNRLRENYT